ncbi:hypothetical protein BVG16_10640 [Paenibacillus selenitireducens]|uniref:Methyl-accepting chemotaxis protein n=1 Tax=Paenibacillus selenitireducens TaxID=1324314 RepID=A0A1T2XEL9_9BACL|nr:HAMP domain-containing methyl-accepting chemotaxis protein [Paenibacillus selenitireducens]OPA78337.1 hypothetical protein BVG16_10640 [Paenibacillus selenitireducens]
MNLLRNLRVGKKLTLLVGILLLLTSALSGYGIYVMNRLAHDTESMYQDVALPTMTLGHYRANNRAIETITFQIMQMVSESEGQQLLLKMESLFSANNEYLNQLMHANISSENKELIQQINQKYQSYMKVVKDTVSLGAQNKNEEAYQYYKDHADALQNTIVSLGDKLEDNNKAYAKSLNDDNTARAEQTSLIMIIGTAIAMILSLLLGIAITKMITYPIQVVRGVIAKAEAGDFTCHVNYDSKDELGMMAKLFNQMLITLRSSFSQIAESSHQLAAFSIELNASAEQTSIASEHIAVSVQEIANGVEEQVRAVEASSSTLEVMAQNAQHIAESAQTVTEQAVQAEGKSVRGIEAIGTVSAQMNTINETIQGLGEVIRGLGARSGEIGLIVDTITGIASQTNLLALNAAIEAARVGEHGKGFAVVAGEVRKLAEESANSAGRISTLVDAIRTETDAAVDSMNLATTEVSNGLMTVNAAGESFLDVQQAVHSVAGQIQDVSTAVQHLASGTEQMFATIQQINETAVSSAAGTQNISAATEEQLATMEEIAASSESLTTMAEELQTNISMFKV